MRDYRPLYHEEKPMNKKTAKGLKIAAISVAGVLAAALFFVGGFFTYRLTMDEGLRSLLWFKEQIDDHYYQDISDEDFWQAAIDGVENILDDYSFYYSADEYDVRQNSNVGVYDGLGLSFFSNTNMIYKVSIGSPVFFAQSAAGERAEAGMYLTGIGESEDSLKDTFTASALSEEISGLTLGTSYVLRLSRSAANDTEDCILLSATFSTYTESYVLYATKNDTYAQLFGDPYYGEWTRVGDGMEELEEGEGYIRLVQFTGGMISGVAIGSFGLAAEQFKEDGCDTLLLDLRNNGGGNLYVLMGIAQYLIAGDGLLSVLYAGDGADRVSYNINGTLFDDYFSNSEIYVMANSNTASASEALMGAMLHYGTIDYDDIYLVKAGGASDAPARTYGKGIMQTTYTNRVTGEAATLTTARIYWPDGTTCIQGRGITSEDGAHRIDATTNADYGDPALSEILASIRAE